MTYALDCLERMRESHEALEVVLESAPVIRCRRCGYAVVATPD